MAGENTAVLGGEDGTLGDQFAATELTDAAGGIYLVGWSDDAPVAGGGLGRVDVGTAEIKRMYVAPTWRGHGLAAALLAELEDAARTRECCVVRLDAGAQQIAAQRLDQRRGYRSIPPYNDYRYAPFWRSSLTRGVTLRVRQAVFGRAGRRWFAMPRVAGTNRRSQSPHDSALVGAASAELMQLDEPVRRDKGLPRAQVP